MKGLSTLALVVSVVVLAYILTWVTGMWINFIQTVVWNATSNLIL